MSSTRDYAPLPHEYLEEMAMLSDAEFGRLVRSLLAYSREGTPIGLSGNERFFAVRVMNREDRYQESYSSSSQQKSEAGKQGAAARWQNGTAISANGKNGTAMSANGKNGYTETETKTETNTETETETNLSAGTARARRFTPPTLDEVIAYCRERGSKVDPERFWSFYNEGGWTDSEGRPVRNWKQKLITWEKHEAQRQEPQDELSRKYEMMKRWAAGG